MIPFRLEACVVARNVEVSFLFPEPATAAIHAFLQQRLPRYHYRRYEIADAYFELQRQDETTILVRRRVEWVDQARKAVVIAPCGANRYLIAPDTPELTAAAQKPVLDVKKQRDDWTCRLGARLGGRHYGSFARASIDIRETAALPESRYRRTFPGYNAIEFEYAGIGKRDCGALIDGFLAFCQSSSIEARARIRGAAHRMDILSRAES